MSYLENPSSEFNWIAAPALASVRVDVGCFQCGREMEGEATLSGKCLSCLSWVSDEDEGFEDLDD